MNFGGEEGRREHHSCYGGGVHAASDKRGTPAGHFRLFMETLSTSQN
jgi:hypothetical protein